MKSGSHLSSARWTALRGSDRVAGGEVVEDRVVGLCGEPLVRASALGVDGDLASVLLGPALADSRRGADPVNQRRPGGAALPR